MTYDIDRHPLVWKDIEDISYFIGDYAGFDVAERKTYEIERTIARLREYPHVGTVRDEIARGLRIASSAEKAVVCFAVNDERRVVRIICVTYAGQDWQRIAKERHGD